MIGSQKFMFQRKWFITFILLFAVSMGLFYRSLSYSFHFDDYSKLILNPAANSPTKALSAFYDRNTQSINQELNRHYYRPLFLVVMSIEKALFHENPKGYRIINIFFHALNATLVSLIAFQLLQLGMIESLICGFIFLVHPAQTESIVWIIEQSNLLATFFILLGIFSWIRNSGFLSPLKITSLWIIFLMGLSIKESAAVIPFILALIAMYELPQKKFHRKISYFLLTMFTLLCLYLFLRHQILGQTSNIWMEQFSLFKYLAPIFIGATMALKFLLWPIGSSINHQPWPLTISYASLILLTIVIPTTLCISLLWLIFKKKSRLALILSIGLVLWLPTSQIIPIKSIFSERFLYLPLIAFSWMVGWLLNRVKRGTSIIAGLYVIALSLVTIRNIPIWKDDQTLWDNALRQNPTFWNSWIQSAEWERMNAYLCQARGLPEPTGWRERSEEKYIKGLKCGFPTQEGAPLFLRLAEINFQQGKFDRAEYHGQRAISLLPELRTDFEKMRRKYVERK